MTLVEEEYMLDELKKSLRLKSPVEIQEKTGAIYHPHAREFSLLYFFQEYRISYKTGEITSLSSNNKLEKEDEIIILHYLNSDAITKGEEEWIYCAKSLIIKNFPQLTRNVENLGGYEDEKYFYLTILPRIVFRLSLDKEVKIFLNKSASFYLPNRCLDYLVDKLLQLL